MKNIIAAIVFCTPGLFASAQKKIEKNFSFNGKNEVNLNLQIADSIKILTWNKNEVGVKVSISINENKDNEDYLVKFDEEGSQIKVKAQLDPEKRRNYQWHSDSNCCRYETDIYWEVYVPEKATVDIETINGNITITGKTSAIKAYSISGFIDLAVPADLKADFKFSTITGTVYSNIAMNNPGASKKSHADIVSKYNGGGTPVSLKTISGDIFVRKP
jgi:hypothetical protein